MRHRTTHCSQGPHKAAQESYAMPAEFRMKSTRRTSAMPSSRTCSSTRSPPLPSAAAATAPRASNGSAQTTTNRSWDERAQQARGTRGVGACARVPACMHALWARACVCDACRFVYNQYCSLRPPQVHAAVGAVCLNLSAASARPLPYGQRDACPRYPAHTTADALPMHCRCAADALECAGMHRLLLVETCAHKA